MRAYMSAYKLLMPPQMSGKSGTSQQRRTFTTSARRLDSKHTAESYFKDVDDSAPSSQKTHQVDSSATGSDVQRPAEPLTGQWSRAGAQTKEYETVCLFELAVHGRMTMFSRRPPRRTPTISSPLLALRRTRSWATATTREVAPRIAMTRLSASPEKDPKVPTRAGASPRAVHEWDCGRTMDEK